VKRLEEVKNKEYEVMRVHTRSPYPEVYIIVEEKDWNWIIGAVEYLERKNKEKSAIIRKLNLGR